MNRRPSYASVAGGNTAASGPVVGAPAKSGAVTHLMPPTSATTSNQTHTEEKERFIRPSYLRRTRYLEKLEAAYKARIASERESSHAAQSHGSKAGSLSKSSSNVSLHRMAPSYRGMTYEIVENNPSPEEDGMPFLPSRWKEYDKSGGLEISADGLDIRCSAIMKGQEHDAASTKADHPMPPQCGIYYFEVSVISKGKEGMVGIGFSGTKAELNKLPGWEQDSWAYHGDDGKSFCCQTPGKAYGATFAAGDVVGCGVNFRDSTAFFTKNGVSQGTAFKDITPMQLYPCVGLKWQGTHVRVNFGQAPFMFDIDGLMAREVALMREEINKADVSLLQPPMDESTLIKELVAQFLRHNGYVDTAKAFADETRIEAKSLNKNYESLASDFELQQDIDAVNRQHIRSAILDGDIDKALKRTNAFYPHVLNDNPNIYFHLRCRKFVEMMRLCTEPFTSNPRGKSTNGNHNNNESFGQDMELDEPGQIGDDWDRMDTEDSVMGPAERMNDTLRYGKELQQEYKDDSSKEKALNEIFALFAYEDARQSPAAHVMDPNGRIPVAEELNSAILVSLGKSSSAAIEKLYQQTDVLIAEITEQGGPGAFVNVNLEPNPR